MRNEHAEILSCKYFKADVENGFGLPVNAPEGCDPHQGCRRISRRLCLIERLHISCCQNLAFSGGE